MIRSLLISMPFLLCAFGAQAQAAVDIPDTLLRNSDAVARLVSTEFVYDSPTSAKAKVVAETTVLNHAAVEKGHFVCFLSSTEQLKSFAGTLRDAQGRQLRKFKRSDLKYSELSAGGLASDLAAYYLAAYSPSYPYTVRYEYEMNIREGLIHFQPFMPIASEGTSLEKGIYTISVPAGMEFAWKGVNVGPPEKTSSGERDLYRWTLEHVPAVKKERAAPPTFDLVPLVLAGPREFSYEKTEGSLRDWAAYGAWQSGLLAGRDRLPGALRAEVHRLTDHLSTPREKVRALYDYMGRTTRYVSIQLGIGGLQPASAEEVFKTKFGDCKALTNYLGAMLRECGIDSDYTIIHTRRRRMYRDFASPTQANHAILRVPLERDTLWLECTNTDIPFGYVHSDIVGHDAILIRNGTGELVTLPQYADTLNRMTRHVAITLAADGSAQGRITERYEGAQYEQMMAFAKKDDTKRTDLLLSDLKIPLAEVTGIVCEERKEALPAIEIGYDIAARKYFNRTGNRWFVPMTPFTKYTSCHDKERLYDIYHPSGYLDITTVEIRMPEDMEVEALPHPCDITVPFGSFSLEVVREKGLLIFRQRTGMHAGTYSREEFGQYRDFINERAKLFNANIVLRKRQAE